MRCKTAISYSSCLIIDPITTRHKDDELASVLTDFFNLLSLPTPFAYLSPISFAILGRALRFHIISITFGQNLILPTSLDPLLRKGPL